MTSIKVNLKIPKGLQNALSGNTMNRVVKESLHDSTMLVRRDASKKAPYKTGTLRRSLTTKVRGNKGYVGTNVVYGPIHEFGGTITPKTKKYLAFKVNGRWVRTRKVRIPKRPYLRPALQENRQKIKKIFQKNMEIYFSQRR